jgi:quinolinate synthase
MDYAKEINRLKKEKNAIILAHYYQVGEIQDIADFVGDSLALSQQAAKTDADVIVFAGVHFMAETAKILNPGKLVLLPDLEAGCSLADSCPASDFSKFKEEHSGATVISYINCSSEIKALSDIICTSSNAKKMVDSVPENQPIIFAPDKNLGRYLAEQTGRDMILWDGSCIVHESFSIDKMLDLKKQHPDAHIIAHPESEEHILKIAEYVGSTSGLLNYVKASDAKTFIVATESGILHQMQKENPEKHLIAAPMIEDSTCACNECPYMKLNTL